MRSTTWPLSRTCGSVSINPNIRRTRSQPACSERRPDVSRRDGCRSQCGALQLLPDRSLQHAHALCLLRRARPPPPDPRRLRRRGHDFWRRAGAAPGVGRPVRKPVVRPKDWSIHPDCPHKFNDGTICVMREEQWRGQFTVALVVLKTAVWLNKYELWKREAAWPGLGQSH